MGFKQAVYMYMYTIGINWSILCANSLNILHFMI